MTETSDKPVVSSRALRIALIASLAVNLAVAGLAIGVFLHGGPGMHGGMVRDPGFGPFDEALRPEDRQALRGAMSARMGDLQASRAQFAADAAAIIAALRTDPFDKAALDAALAAQQAHVADRMKLGSDVLGGYLASLPADARKAFADRMEHRIARDKDAPPPAN